MQWGHCNANLLQSEHWLPPGRRQKKRHACTLLGAAGLKVAPKVWPFREKGEVTLFGTVQGSRRGAFRCITNNAEATPSGSTSIMISGYRSIARDRSSLSYGNIWAKYFENQPGKRKSQWSKGIFFPSLASGSAAMLGCSECGLYQRQKSNFADQNL